MDTVNQPQTESNPAVKSPKPGTDLLEKPVPGKPTAAAPNLKAKPKRLSHRTCLKLMIAAVVLMVGATYLFRNLILGTPVDTDPARVSALQQTVVASGRVATPQRVSVASVLAGRIAEIVVREGQTVDRGQLLIRLDAQEGRAAFAQSESAVQQAAAGVRKQRELALPAAAQVLAKAQSEQNQAQQQFSRIAALQKQGYVSRLQLDEARRNFEVAQSQTRNAALSLQSNQAQGSDAVAAKAALAQASASLQQSAVKLAQLDIVAPVSGTLITRQVEPGDTVAPNQPLMLLAPLGKIEILVLIDEKNFGKLAIGQTALASADAYPDQQFVARVSYINPGIDAARGSVALKLSVAEPPAYLQQDMTVSVDIETASRTRALIIPTASVRELSSDAPWVMVVRGHRTVRQDLKLGLRGDENIEVLSGLAAGEPVLMAELATIKIGQRVRLKSASKSEPISQSLGEPTKTPAP